MTQPDNAASAEPGPAAIPDFTAEIADAWAKLRAVDAHDLDRVEAWLATVRAGYHLTRALGGRTTLDDLPTIAMDLHASGRRPRALAFQRSLFQAGWPPPPVPADGSEQDALGAVRRAHAAMEALQQPHRIAAEALALATLLVASPDDEVPAACRLLSLAIYEAGEA